MEKEKKVCSRCGQEKVVSALEKAQVPADAPVKISMAALPHMDPKARKFLVDSPSMQRDVSDMITILDLNPGTIKFFINFFMMQVDYLKPLAGDKLLA